MTGGASWKTVSKHAWSASYFYGSFSMVQHTYGETLVSLLINIALSLYNLGSLN